MKLTNYIVDLGRVLAYYPSLKKVTGSTTASILLCQFLYWCDKTSDGWIWKDSNEIEYETGLTYNEQKTARKALVDLNLLEEENRKLSHQIRFKVNQEVLNILWEQQGGKKTKVIAKAKAKEAPIKKQITTISEPIIIEEKPTYKDEPMAQSFIISEPVEQLVRNPPAKKGDLVDGIIAMASSSGMQKMNKSIEIRKKIEKKLHVNTDNAKWEKFIEFVYVQEEKHKQPVDTFLIWALKEGFNPVYWTPEKMKTLWPQAFVEDDYTNKPREDFVPKLPDRVEETYMPMPKDIGRKRELF